MLHIVIMEGKLFFSMKIIVWLFLVMSDEHSSSHSQGEFKCISLKRGSKPDHLDRFVACNTTDSFCSTKNSWNVVTGTNGTEISLGTFPKSPSWGVGWDESIIQAKLGAFNQNTRISDHLATSSQNCPCFRPRDKMMFHKPIFNATFLC